jgi:hypothetical protein
MQCTGSWQDEFATVWKITSNASQEVAGTATSHVVGCVSQKYTVSGTLTAVTGIPPANGFASVDLTASGPQPGTDPHCNVAPTVNLTGNIENDGCDLVGPANAVEVSVFGSFDTTFSKPTDVPSGETTNFEGWSSGTLATVGQWRGKLTSSLNLNGKQVAEMPTGGTITDSCYFTGSTVPRATLSGGYWNVGYYFTNDWDDDYVGFTTAAVTYYRANNRPPCSTTIPQEMVIYADGENSGSYIDYALGSVGEGIPNDVSVTSTRDGQTKMLNWP